MHSPPASAHAATAPSMRRCRTSDGGARFVRVGDDVPRRRLFNPGML